MIHPVISDRGITHFFKATQKYNREDGRKNKRTNTDLGQLQAQEREFCDTLHSPCICRLSPVCILRETSTKATRNANSCLIVFPHCHLLLTILLLDCYLTPTGLFCSPLSTALCVFPGTFLSSSTSGLVGDLVLSPLCGFCAKTDEELVWVAPTQTPNTTNDHIVSH